MEEGRTMAQFGLVGSFTAQPGQRDALVALLLEAASLLETFPNCDLWFVSTAPDDPDAVWVTEVWRNQAAHAASLGDARVQEIIGRGRPLIAGFGTRITLEPIGGKGLS
jgi:quinol monooxygenase YgiN